MIEESIFPEENPTDLLPNNLIPDFSGALAPDDDHRKKKHKKGGKNKRKKERKDREIDKLRDDCKKLIWCNGYLCAQNRSLHELIRIGTAASRGSLNTDIMAAAEKLADADASCRRKRR